LYLCDVEILKIGIMYTSKDNNILKNEISIYKDEQLVASVNKLNFNTDQEAYDFVEYLVSSLNSNK